MGINLNILKVWQSKVDAAGTPSPSVIANSVSEYFVANPVSTAWGSISNKPSTFPPSTHTHGYEPADPAIQIHITSTHAPSNAQKNSDITKAEIEAKLTGEISSHTHAGGSGLTLPQSLAKSFVGC